MSQSIAACCSDFVCALPLAASALPLPISPTNRLSRSTADCFTTHPFQCCYPRFYRPYSSAIRRTQQGFELPSAWLGVLSKRAPSRSALRPFASTTTLSGARRSVKRYFSHSRAVYTPSLHANPKASVIRSNSSSESNSIAMRPRWPFLRVSIATRVPRCRHSLSSKSAIWAGLVRTFALGPGSSSKCLRTNRSTSRTLSRPAKARLANLRRSSSVGSDRIARA